ncbi:MAG: 3-oxoacid CoA-transferase subunit A [Chloroflexi bacterium]|nr:3-oxoacid CoA-transferase subunit A [Chloroflexota bacterium]
MPDSQTLNNQQMARRVAREFSSGEVVALGSGLPCLIPEAIPAGQGVLFLSESGALGYTAGPNGQPRDGGQNLLDAGGQGVAVLPGGTIVSAVDYWAMVRGGHVNTAVIEPAQVSSTGDFSHWTTAATPGLFSAAGAVGLGDGPGRVIAMMPHSGPGGAPTLVDQCAFPVDGAGCVSLIITDVAVFIIDGHGLTLSELAPGWSAGDVEAITEAPFTRAEELRLMSFDLQDLAAPNKVFDSGLAAIWDLPDGATVMIDGFAGPGGMPQYLMVSLRDHGAKDLTMISNTAGVARVMGFGTPEGRLAIDHSILVDSHQIRKAIASYPVSPSAVRPSAFELALQRGEVDLEVVPQGTLAERIRAGGAGVAAFFTPTGVGTLLTEGKETQVIGGKEYVLEQALRADFCLIRGHKADTLGNVVYKGTSRNFNAVMAPAAATTVIEVDEIVEAGELDPEEIVTPGVYINRIVKRPDGFSPYE